MVREWHAEQGWGVVDAPGTPGGCWAHFSAVVMEGYRSLEPGQVVEIEIEAVEQDGFAVRAAEVRPVGVTPPPPDLGPEGSAAYRSSLTIRYDDGTTFTTQG